MNRIGGLLKILCKAPEIIVFLIIPELPKIVQAPEHNYSAISLMVITTFLFGVVILGCKKSDPPADPPTNLQLGHECVPKATEITDTELLHCRYLEGTWWAYKDSVTGKKDTLKLLSVSQGTNLVWPHFSGCAPARNYHMDLKMMNEPEPSLGISAFTIYYEGIMFSNKNMWQQTTPPFIFGPGLGMYKTKIHDSLYITDRYYLKAAESPTFQYLTAADKNRMVPVNVKVYFSSEFGPVQFDYRDRLSGELKSRLQIVNSNILRAK